MLTPKDVILFKIVHTCAKECLILKYKYIQNPCFYQQTLFMPQPFGIKASLGGRVQLLPSTHIPACANSKPGCWWYMQFQPLDTQASFYLQKGNSMNKVYLKAVLIFRGGFMGSALVHNPLIFVETGRVPLIFTETGCLTVCFLLEKCLCPHWKFLDQPLMFENIVAK